MAACVYIQSFYAKNEEASRFERLWSFQIHSNLVWKLSHLFWFRINHNVSSSRAPMGGENHNTFQTTGGFWHHKIEFIYCQGSSSCRCLISSLHNIVQVMKYCKKRDQMRCQHSTMQNTCLTNYSSVLVCSAKGFQLWVGGSQHPFSCVLGHFWHGD